MTTIVGKKILFVITKSNWGGAQTYVFRLAKSMREAGADVAVALGGTGLPGAEAGMLKKKLAAESIRTLFLKSFARDISILREFHAFGELMRTIQKERPDILHVNSSKAGGLGALAGRLVGVPRIVFTSHGLAYDEDRPWIKRFLIGLATWATFLFAHKTIVISEDTFRRAKRLPLVGHKVVLIYNGIVSPGFLSREEARTALSSKDLRLLTSAQWIGTVAELHLNKGLEWLIRALSIVPPSTKLVIIGTGELKEKLSSLVAELGFESRIVFLGHVPDAARYIKAFDIFALPSLKEGLPYVLMEAGSADLPVVGSSIPGIEDLIRDRETGILTPPKDVEALGKAIGELLQNPIRAKQLGEALGKRVRSEFSLERMVAGTVAVYNA